MEWQCRRDKRSNKKISAYTKTKKNCQKTFHQIWLNQLFWQKLKLLNIFQLSRRMKLILKVWRLCWRCCSYKRWLGPPWKFQDAPQEKCQKLSNQNFSQKRCLKHFKSLTTVSVPVSFWVIINDEVYKHQSSLFQFHPFTSTCESLYSKYKQKLNSSCVKFKHFSVTLDPCSNYKNQTK